MSGKNKGKSLPIEAPTDKPRLSDAGEKLLEVLKVPELRAQSVTSICQHADISRDSYYRLWKSPDFMQAYSGLCKDTLLSFALPASQALGKQAEMGDVQAIKMILEMAGVYSPSTKIETTVKHDIGPNLLELYHARQRAIE